MIVDLSQPITERTPVYPGDPTVKIQRVGVLEKDKYCDHVVTMGTHVGTHIDAPMHMLAGGVGLNEIAPERFIARGVCVDVRDGFDSLYNADVRKGDIVLLYFGFSEKYHEAAYFDSYPTLTSAVAEYLISKKVNMVGTDTCSPDGLEDYPVHRQLLSADVLIIENLTNLDRLLEKSCIVYVFPIALQIDAAPARVLADIPE